MSLSDSGLVVGMGEVEMAFSVEEVVGEMEGRVRGEPRNEFLSMPGGVFRG